MRVEFDAAQTGDVAQGIVQRAVSPVEPFGNRVYLGAVTGAKHHRFTNDITGHKPVHKLGSSSIVKGKSFQHLEGRTAVVHTENENTHDS